ncbi:Bardet-Biedl syndrome 12 protein [Rana temporaria]|uniref:Bardet-Biedl syndrome 12 protein n=1 Tax=Rana temporaria TaxID=8407 RepID=UPI001AACD3A4|nr:Bardet-Biedl syndrome 12 protein [Rana temporaria]XP_040186415.1 Bardet-Biedl syndrome 12 protein [Rana temporaria]
MAIGAHIGLKELCDLSSSVKSFLGPLKSHKFIYDQDTQESSLTCSAFRLLGNLHLTGAVGQLLHETIQAHHKTYKTGTTSLFFLVGAWSKAVLEGLHQGVPVALIVSIMQEGLNSCIEIVESLHIEHECVLNLNSSNQILARDISDACSKNRSVSCIDQPVATSGFYHSNNLPKNRMQMQFPQRGGIGGQARQMNRLSHSRHFSVSNKSCFHSSGSTLPTNNHTLMDLTRSLSHGSLEAMSLVEEAVRHLCESVETKSVTKDLFRASRLELCFLKGQSEAFSNASLGYTTLLAAENCALVKGLEGKSLKALLVDGEVAENYRHVGFIKATNVRAIAEFKSEKSDLSWINTVCKRIIHAGIDIILVRGDVCQQFMIECSCRGILVIPRVRQNVLQAFSECTGAELVTYLAQINCNSIGCHVYVSVCMRGDSILQCGQRIAVNLKAKGLNFVTAVISCRWSAKEQLLEDEFWACAYRLHHALYDQKVFPGGGAVELLCLHHLRKLEEMAGTFSPESKGSYPSSWLSTTAIHSKGYIYKCLADGFCKYLSVLFYNMGECSSELEAMTFINNELKNIRDFSSPSSYILNKYVRNLVSVDGQELSSSYRPTVYDNVIPKLEAWRRALHLVLIVLQSDAEIITGSAAHKQTLKGDFITGEHLAL